MSENLRCPKLWGLGGGGGVFFLQILAVRMSLCAFLVKNDSTNPADGQVSCAEDSRMSFSSYFLVRGRDL